jgi:serine/threonine protein kinase
MRLKPDPVLTRRAIFTLMPDKSNKPNTGAASPLPAFIAHYRILQRLGKGGMGEVFLGEDTKQLQRKVGLKVLPSGLLKEEG